MQSEFDHIIDRRGTNCAKWDEMDEKYGLKDVIHLGVADMDFRPPEAIRAEVLKIAGNGVWGYTNTSREFYQCIAKWYFTQHGCDVPEEWILFCPRINVAASVLVETFSEPNQEVMIHSPFYMPLFQAAAKNKRMVLESPLKWKNGRYTMDFRDMEKRVSKNTKLLFLCSPHNPTTRIWTKEELKQLEEFCVKHNLILVSDEIHSDIKKEGQNFLSALTLGDELKKRLVITNSPTKTFNIPGVIVSYLIIPNPLLRERVKETIDRLGMHNPTVFSGQALHTGYTKCHRWLKELNQYIDKNERMVCDFIHQEMPMFEVIPREGTFLLWINYQKLNCTEEELEAWFINKAHVGVYMGSTFGKEGLGFLRLNLGTSRELLRKALDQMNQAYKELISEDAMFKKGKGKL